MRLDNQWLSIPKAAKLLGRSNKMVHRAIARGDIPAQRIKGCHPLIAAGTVAKLMSSTPADAVPVRLVEPVPAV
jgi:excisionase family DNA binding protein